MKVFKIFILILFIISCGRHSEPDRPDYKSLKEPLIGANRILVRNDADRIEAHARRNGWPLNQTGSGLWYWIIENKNQPRIKSGNVVTLNYHLSLLNGSYCYSSDSSGPLRFKAGQGGVESGLEEAVLMLGKGDSARFVLPPHLAHGLTGDGKKIPARAIIVYDIRVLNVSN